MKKIIKEVVVVEGKTDTQKLKQLFDVDTIETNGLNVTKDLINLLMQTNKSRGIVLFLDPDGPGEKIRKICSEKIEICKHAFIDKNKFKFKKKVGIAESPNELIIEALGNIVTFDKTSESLSWNEYQNFKLDTKLKRKVVTDYLKISECNNKQLFKRLNMIGINMKTLGEIINGNI